MKTLENWPRCPEAAAFFAERLQSFLAVNPITYDMANRFWEQAGVNLLNLVDHWSLPSTPELIAELTACGLTERATDDGDCVWEHPAARLPRVRLQADLSVPRLALEVEDVARFLAANDLTPTAHLGDPDSCYEEAFVPSAQGELVVVARRGYRGFRPGRVNADMAQELAWARDAFANRDREGDEATVLRRTHHLVEQAIERLGRDRATDEFFAAERNFYVQRNRAAAWQYAQQQRLGFGWANHDHHTYRCSRESFRALLRLWHTFGFVSRERFYAGAEAGWGAQVMEHPVSRVVLFCDVDMAPEELNIDFADADLPARESLGTIGLWCALHGSSIAQAGMHHLEAEFDFARAKECLEAAGFGVMAPFTDLPMLKQAFTEPEIWPVSNDRLVLLLERGLITEEQARRFRTQGAAGSHLEILQRRDGFKGFNKTGISDIIRQTDARRT